jgi:hypothetical protein
VMVSGDYIFMGLYDAEVCGVNKCPRLPWSNPRTT